MSSYILGFGGIEITEGLLPDEVEDFIAFMEEHKCHNVEYTKYEAWDSIGFEIDGNNWIDYDPLEAVICKLKEMELEFNVSVNEFVANDNGGFYYDSEDEEDE